MPLFRLPPILPQEEYDQFGRVQRVLVAVLLVLYQRFFDLVSAAFGGLSVFFICVRVPLRSWHVSGRRLGFVGGDDAELMAHRWRVSLSLAILHGLLVFNWFGAVMRCRWLTHRRRNHAGHWEAPQNKAVVQVDDPERDLGVLWPVAQASGETYALVRGRLRRCESCGPRADRMYHCLELGKCLPLFNHFCNALNVPVYLETVKPYLSFLFLLSLDGFVVLGSCVWAWSDQQLRSAAIEGSLLFLATLLFCYAGFMLWQVGRTMAVRNIVWPELGRDGEFRGTYMAAQEETPNRVVVRWRWFANNPWDLGKWSNFCALMGRPRSWLL